MGTIKAKEIAKSEVLRLEAEINNLWGELNTTNIPHAIRMEMEEKLSKCEDEFKAVLGGQVSFQSLERKLREIDKNLAKSVIEQAEHELPKGERAEKSHLALETVRRQFTEGKWTPIRARHEVKEIMRTHTT